MEKKDKVIGNYHILQTLGSGSEAKVKLVVQNEEKYAAKIFYGFHSDRKYSLKLQKEVNILKKLKEHPHIIQYIEDYPNAQIIKKNGNQFQTDCIIVEYCENGSLFDWIEGTGPFNEVLARSIFHQLIYSLEHIHFHNICHNDLKPENILFQSNFSLKITDFGMAKDNSDLDRSFSNNQYLKYTVYHAPEIIEQKLTNHAAADIFAAGVILFIIITGHLPFNEASIHAQSDKYYKLIYNKDYQQFWQLHSKNKGKKEFFSDDLKSLLQMMFEYNPDQRITLQQIRQHPWFNSNVLTQQEIAEEFYRRNSDFQNYKEEIRIEKMYQKPNKVKNEKMYSGSCSKLIQPTNW